MNMDELDTLLDKNQERIRMLKERRALELDEIRTARDVIQEEK